MPARWPDGTNRPAPVYTGTGYLLGFAALAGIVAVGGAIAVALPRERPALG